MSSRHKVTDIKSQTQLRSARSAQQKREPSLVAALVVCCVDHGDSSWSGKCRLPNLRDIYIYYHHKGSTLRDNLESILATLDAYYLHLKLCHARLKRDPIVRHSSCQNGHLSAVTTGNTCKRPCWPVWALARSDRESLSETSRDYSKSCLTSPIIPSDVGSFHVSWPRMYLSTIWFWTPYPVALVWTLHQLCHHCTDSAMAHSFITLPCHAQWFLPSWLRIPSGRLIATTIWPLRPSLPPRHHSRGPWRPLPLDRQALLLV